MKEVEKEIKSLLFELGLPCIQRKVILAPSCEIIHFDVQNIRQIADVPKKIKFLSAYLHIDISIVKSDTAHFALSIPMTNSKVNFLDKKYEYLFDGFEDRPFGECMKIFAGIDDNNQPVMLDLNETPHILIAGTTGSGKSVMMNSIICSLLKTNSYTEFTMIDTKRVELAPYKKLNHCLVINDAELAVDALYNVCEDVEVRYEIMEQKGLRKIEDDYYHHLVVIEELGDLMSSPNCKLIEQYIVKIARLGRACGVHLLIATQRPTTDVVTGEIKANIGCRFALQTTSAVDSRNILGHGGAEHLKGKGDCLLKLPTQAEEIHLQCPYLSDEDIENIIRENLYEKNNH